MLDVIEDLLSCCEKVLKLMGFADRNSAIKQMRTLVEKYASSELHEDDAFRDLVNAFAKDTERQPLMIDDSP